MTECSKCGENFYCGVEKGDNDCWCFHKPKKQPNGKLCYCEECLMKSG